MMKRMKTTLIGSLNVEMHFPHAVLVELLVLEQLVALKSQNENQYLTN